MIPSRLRRSGGADALLIARWIGSSASRRSAAVLGTTFALLAVTFVCVSSFALSADQQAARAFGPFDQTTISSVQIGDLAPTRLAEVDARLDAVAPGGHVFLESTQLRPDPFAKTYIQGPIANVGFVQDDQLDRTRPGRYTLESGSWPMQPRDVVVSRHLRDQLPDRSSFSVLSGLVTFLVVGEVTDDFARHADLIVAAPGTWESIVPRPPGRSYQPVEASVVAMWGRTPFAEVAPVLDDALPPLPAAAGARADYLRDNHSTRSDLAPAATSFGAGQLSVSYLPLLLVGLLVSAAVVGQAAPPSRAAADRLVAAGVRRGRVVRAQTATGGVVGLVSIVAGSAIGWLVACVARPVVLERVADQPLSPVPGPSAPLVAVAAICWAVLVAGHTWGGRTRLPGSPGAMSVRAHRVARLVVAAPWSVVRRVLVVALLVAAATMGGGRGSVTDSFLTVAAVLLLAPDVLRLALVVLPTSSPRGFVTGRLMRTDRGRQGVAVLVVACCVALPIAAGTQLASKKASDATFTYGYVPDGQMWVEAQGGPGDVAAVARIVSGVPGVSRPTAVRALTTGAGADTTTALFVAEPRRDGFTNATIMVVDSADDLRRVVGTGLPPAADRVLETGGVLDFTGAAGDQQFAVYAPDGQERVTPTLRTLDVRLDRQLTTSFGGAILLSTAQQLGLPVSAPATFLYPDVSAPVIRAAVAAVVEAGFDSEFVLYAVPPPSPDLPTSGYVFLGCLLLGCFAILVLVMRGQARRLSDYGDRLVSLGLAPRWTLSVLAIQGVVTLAVGFVTGGAAGLVGIAIATDTYVVVDVPWAAIGAASGVTVLVIGLATVLGMRSVAVVRHGTS